MSSTSRSEDRQKIGAEHTLSLGQLEAVEPTMLPYVIGKVVGDTIAAVLEEEGTDVDSLNVIVSPECTDEAELAEADAAEREPTADVLVVRVWAERDRPPA